ncbi:hypothetical protein THAOC_34181, partial [Thalassiosira oceanica]
PDDSRTQQSCAFCPDGTVRGESGNDNCRDTDESGCCQDANDVCNGSSFGKQGQCEQVGAGWLSFLPAIFTNSVCPFRASSSVRLVKCLTIREPSSRAPFAQMERFEAKTGPAIAATPMKAGVARTRTTSVMDLRTGSRDSAFSVRPGRCLTIREPSSRAPFAQLERFEAETGTASAATPMSLHVANLRAMSAAMMRKLLREGALLLRSDVLAIQAIE